MKMTSWYRIINIVKHSHSYNITNFIVNLISILRSHGISIALINFIHPPLILWITSPKKMKQKDLIQINEILNHDERFLWFRLKNKTRPKQIIGHSNITISTRYMTNYFHFWLDHLYGWLNKEITQVNIL